MDSLRQQGTTAFGSVTLRGTHTEVKRRTKPLHIAAVVGSSGKSHTERPSQGLNKNASLDRLV